VDGGRLLLVLELFLTSSRAASWAFLVAGMVYVYRRRVPPAPPR